MVGLTLLQRYTGLVRKLCGPEALDYSCSIRIWIMFHRLWIHLESLHRHRVAHAQDVELLATRALIVATRGSSSFKHGEHGSHSGILEAMTVMNLGKHKRSLTSQSTRANMQNMPLGITEHRKVPRG